MSERVLPHSLEAERSVLGAVLLLSDVLGDVIDSLPAEDFFRGGHAAIYRAMCDLWRAGTVIDLITLKNELTRRGQLDEVGGPAYMARLVDGVPRTTNVAYYAEIIRSKARFRELIDRATKIAASAYAEEETPAALIEAAEQSLRETAQRTVSGWFVDSRELAQRVYAQIGNWQERRGVTGLTTGFTDLDDITSGLHPGDLVLVAARPSMGKTALALQIADHVAIRHQQHTALFPLEMSVDSVGVRIACSRAEVDMYRARHGWLQRDDMGRITSALMPIEDGKLYIDDGLARTVADIRRKARQLQAREGLSLLIIDYLQLLDPPSGRRQNNRNEDVSAVSRSLKLLAMELQIPVIALSQLSRALEARPDKRPKMHDLRDSGSLEQDADIVLFIYRESVYDERADNIHLAELIIAKHRNGPLGTVNLEWTPQFTRFKNVQVAA